MQDAIVAPVSEPTHPQHSAWRLVDRDGTVPWLSGIATNHQEAGIFTFDEPCNLDDLRIADTTTRIVRPADVGLECLTAAAARKTVKEQSVRSCEIHTRQLIRRERYSMSSRESSSWESTFQVAHLVVSALHMPFLIVLMGSSGGGKPHTTPEEDGIIETIIGSLPSPVDITVPQIGKTTRPMADLLFPKHSVAETPQTIHSSCTTSQTPANTTSSRTHIMVQFENLTAGIVNGCLMDVYRVDVSGSRAEQGAGGKACCTAIAQENVAFRLMLMGLAAGGKSGLMIRGRVSVVEHASPLSLAVGRFLSVVLGAPEIRVVACWMARRWSSWGGFYLCFPNFRIGGLLVFVRI